MRGMIFYHQLSRLKKPSFPSFIVIILSKNPQTGEELQIKARKVVKFTPGQPLKDAAS
jgi:hypothetical protein